MGRRKILLTGADGLLGRALKPILEEAGEVFAPGLDQFDLNRTETIVDAFHVCRPDVVVHLAAETRVDYCEEHPEEALRINATGTTAVAAACREHKARLVAISSDYVFDGNARVPYKETDPTAPINVYGRSKEEAERVTRLLVEESLVVRSSSLYGLGGRHFVGSILAAAEKGIPLRVVADQRQSPTYVRHLAPALARVSLSDATGIVHLSGEGECSWFEFAQAILSLSRKDLSCEPMTTQESDRPARRPHYSVLSGELATRSYGITLPHWRDALAEFLDKEGP